MPGFSKGLPNVPPRPNVPPKTLLDDIPVAWGVIELKLFIFCFKLLFESIKHKSDDSNRIVSRLDFDSSTL